MDIAQFLPSLVGLLAGAAISALAFYGKARIERKRVIALALADLLEIRHRMKGPQVLIAEIRAHIKVPVTFDALVADLWRKSYPADPALHQRYDAAVTLLAGIDPLLAFDMRSKDLAPQLPHSLRDQGLLEELDAGTLYAVESTLHGIISPAIDEAIQTLANEHSWSTGRKIRRYLRQKPEMPPEFRNLVQEIARKSSAEPAAGKTQG